MNPRQAFEKAVEIGGGQSELGRRIGKNQQYLSYHLKKGVAPAEIVLRIEEITGMPRENLRPDLYPGSSKNAADGESAQTTANAVQTDDALQNSKTRDDTDAAAAA